ncbi:hypothetical protein DL766_003531 [Monosporascus sp. MC13-8B]|uniref:Uncharacterized protein n=1 Tax=Monosporascus cannonballus TaxID=155416 RepID=A0ABY0HBE9_9PEZI|nr:hypothetical protein DL762_004650 [Monosporascus cannonballus]RYO95878.1 hypothetical protein DL763_003512 [Monosporascus cannonballus]RYP33302.1 hypothetical protein DL766_003531 [Monosporascus sp. MC13-8B]
MTTYQLSDGPRTHPVRQIGQALGIGEWDNDSYQGLLNFVYSRQMGRLMADVMGTYLERRNDTYHFPSVPSVLRAALAYISPSPNPDDSIDPDIVKALAECKGRPGWGDQFHIALFAARVVRSAENDFGPLVGSSSRAMAWFPARPHHKLALAVAVMYFLYPKLTRQPLSMNALKNVERAYQDALSYLSSNFRCIECGRDFPEDSDNIRPRPPAACTVCPTLEDGEILEFERLREPLSWREELLLKTGRIDHDLLDGLTRELAVQEEKAWRELFESST